MARIDTQCYHDAVWGFSYQMEHEPVLVERLSPLEGFVAPKARRSKQLPKKLTRRIRAAGAGQVALPV